MMHQVERAVAGLNESFLFHCLTGLAVDFDPGDIVVVHPENCKEDVEEFFRLFGLDASMSFMVAPTQDNTPLPPVLAGEIELGECVRKYFDLTYIPKR